VLIGLAIIRCFLVAKKAVARHSFLQNLETLALETQPIRLIVCDWQMLDLDGMELCRRMRGNKGEYVYFILYMEANASNENEDAAIDAGVDDFLQKPVNLRDLRICLHVARRILDCTTHIQELQSLIPICSYCKSVRDDEDYWQQIEKYVADQTGSEFTHSVCPTCYDRHIIPQFTAMNIVPPPKQKNDATRCPA
jgi:DNA-binding response OmpR family regulator